MNFRVLVAAAALVVSATGCAGLAFGSRGVPMGGLYSDTVSNEQLSSNSLGDKSGEACSSSILGLITTGDSSVATAAKKGGISKVGSVEAKHSNIIGIISTYCVVAHGE